jgi:O-antigen/teichoic acid export membrane protein
LTPHFSRDWEEGRKRHVACRQRLAIKIAGLALTAAGAVFLLAAPILFRAAFLGKYSAGLAILPWTTACCAWTALATLSQTYLWCALKARLAMIALVVGLACNAGLGVVVLPVWGLPGLAFTTAVAHLVSLATLFGLLAAAGMPLDRGMWACALAPAALGTGGWGAAAVVALLIGLAATGRHIFTGEDRQHLRAGLQAVLPRWLGRLAPVTSPPTCSES